MASPSDDISILSREFDEQFGRVLEGGLGQGEQIGNYVLVKKLGEGGFGVVYLAQQERPLRRQVALKVIKLGMDTREVVTRFEAERQALALLDHPHVAKVLDAGATEQGRPFFVMELVDGVPITEYCDEHRLRVRERLELFVQVCEAIQHAHQKGIVHRDIKPSNILVRDHDGRHVPKVIDFGIAKAIGPSLTEETVFTEQGLLIGTPEYMSPEQADFSIRDVDTRSDVYALGVLLYELLAGSLPYGSEQLRGRGFQEMVRVICHEPPLRPSTRLGAATEGVAVAALRQTTRTSLLRQVRGDLDWIVLRALEKDRTLRYPTASELGAEVNRFLRHEPVLAGPPTVGYRLRKFYERRRVGILLSAFLLVVLVAASLGSWHASSERQRRLRASQSRAAIDSGNARRSRYQELDEELADLAREYASTQEAYEKWQPVWEREVEVRLSERLTEAREEKDRLYGLAVLDYSNAADLAGDEDDLRRPALRALEATYWGRYQEALREGMVPMAPAYFESMLRSLELDTYALELEGIGRASFEDIPSDASVHCFLYVEHEQRLVPLPFSPERGARDPNEGVVGRTFLEVERRWDEIDSVLRPGDRILRVSGKIVEGLVGLARALEQVDADEAVQVTLLRDFVEQSVPWVPFATARGSLLNDALQAVLGDDLRLLDPRSQLGVTFAGYPLDYEAAVFTDARPDGRVDLHLPRGSYLFVVRRPGYAEARYPVSLPGPTFHARVRLLRKNDVPDGYVHVPAGPFRYGGDRDAFQSLDYGEENLPGFLMARHEVSTREFLAFVNDPEVFARTGTDGQAIPTVPMVRELLSNGRLPRDDYALIPWDFKEKRLFWVKRGGAWRLQDTWKSLDWPVANVSMLAAIEYAAWLTRKHGNRWQFRLPTDLEWEKAARGADRRIYTWGNYLVRNFATTASGTIGPGRPHRVLAAPLDESPYGVRDLVGSVREFTSGQPEPSYQYRSVRGSSFNVTDDFYCRLATRNGLLPWSVSRTSVGIRLVAEVPD